jgi:hypothetical protein
MSLGLSGIGYRSLVCGIPVLSDITWVLGRHGCSSACQNGAVVGCSHKSGVHGCSFYHFPNDTRGRSKWIRLCT